MTDERQTGTRKPEAPERGPEHGGFSSQWRPSMDVTLEKVE
jgi:hypothetical protein